MTRLRLRLRWSRIVPNEPRGDASRPAPAQPLSRGEFDALAREQWPRVLRFATAFLGDRHLAEDMVQAGLHRLYEHRDRYPLRTHFGPYLVKTVARLCIDQKRGRRGIRDGRGCGGSPRGGSRGRCVAAARPVLLLGVAAHGTRDRPGRRLTAAERAGELDGVPDLAAVGGEILDGVQHRCVPAF